MASDFQGPSGNRFGILGDLVQNGRLAWRLLRDHRVPSVLKFVVPGLMGAYLLMPIDLLPDVVPFIGQIDDLAILALGVKLFIELSPKDVVQELRMAMTQGSKPPPVNPSRPGNGEVVDAEYRVVK